MKAKLILAIVLISAGLAGAQDKMTEMLRKGILEEESNQNLEKAIQAYQSIATQYDEERKTAAIAMFRLADCYRKLGKKDQAIATYRRVVQEFPDQAKLADMSRNHLSKTYGINQNPNAESIPPQVGEARRQYRTLLEDEIKLVEEQIAYEQKRIEIGTASAMGEKITRLRRDLIELKRTLVAYDSSFIQPPPTSSRR